MIGIYWHGDFRNDEKIKDETDDPKDPCCRGTRLVFPLPGDMGIEINYRSSIRVLCPGGDQVTYATITDHHGGLMEG